MRPDAEPQRAQRVGADGDDVVVGGVIQQREAELEVPEARAPRGRHEGTELAAVHAAVEDRQRGQRREREHAGRCRCRRGGPQKPRVLELERDGLGTGTRGERELLQGDGVQVGQPRRDEEEQRPRHAHRREAKPRRGACGRDGAGAADVGGGQGDEQAIEGRRGVGVEGGVDGVDERGRAGGRRRRRVGAVNEDELGHVCPEVAPAAGEHAGARRGAGAAEADQDVMQQLVGEAADAVLAAGAAAAAAAFFAHHKRRRRQSAGYDLRGRGMVEGRRDDAAIHRVCGFAIASSHTPTPTVNSGLGSSSIRAWSITEPISQVIRANS